MNKKGKIHSRGTTLVEAMISMLILAFVIVSILNGFSQQQVRSRSMSERAVAIQLAELRLEELLKFATPQMVDEIYTDYIISTKDGFVVYDDQKQYDPEELNQFRRTTSIEIDAMSEMATIRVRVDYPLSKEKTYPFKIEVSSRRGIK